MEASRSSPTFICDLPGPSGNIAYHLAVLLDDTRPTKVIFTSFVGAGRRSFEVQASDVTLPLEPGAGNYEAICRIAIGQVIRDNLHDKLGVGNFVLDPSSERWTGELKAVGKHVRTSVNLPNRF
ncbi:hypothetical protein [Cupriavidus sp. RAF12]|uniref:hypothetical protein n=1 Tax=Cupriavidus sp. RAF12 TaxID=3233050 RepID=UPI003F8D98CA